MRNHLINYVEQYAESHPDIVVMTGDLGYNVLENFAKKHPRQFYNVGIAEQSMASIAAGLAMSRNKVIMYSIGNFVTLRCLEQIRNSICYHNCDVKIISIGGGIAYSQLGMSHHATEDIAAMRMLPNMIVYAPFDPYDAELAIADALDNSSPCYIRLEKNNEHIYSEIADRNVNSITKFKDGLDIAVISYGSIVSEALKAHYANSAIGVYSITKLKPIDKSKILALLEKYKTIITLEEHNLIGGLYSIVSEISSSNGCKCKIVPLSFNDKYTSIVGDRDYLRKVYKLDAEYILSECEGI